MKRTCFFYVSSLFSSKFFISSFIKELNLLKFLIKDLINEFILCGDDNNNIISVLVLLSFDYFFPLLHIDISSDFGEKDTKRENNDTPCSIDDIPNSWGLFMYFNDFTCDLISNSLEDGFSCKWGLITSPQQSIKVTKSIWANPFRNS